MSTFFSSGKKFATAWLLGLEENRGASAVYQNHLVSLYKAGGLANGYQIIVYHYMVLGDPRPVARSMRLLGVKAGEWS